MAKLLKLRRGTTSQHGSFTGAEGEVTVDTNKDTLVVHDGSTAGGHPVAAEDMANVSSVNILSRIGTGTIANAKLIDDSITEAKLDISNAPSDGKFLQYKDNTDKLTWTDVDLTSIPGTTFTADVSFSGAANNVVWDKSDNALDFEDNAKANFGHGNDLQIYHDGTNSYIHHGGAGNLNTRIGKDNGEYHILGNGNTDVAKFKDNGTVELYFDGNKKLHTRTDGIEVTGVVSASDHVYLPDNKKLRLGNAPDLELYHDGTQSVIKDTSGKLQIFSEDIEIYDADGGYYIDMVADGAVNLYHDAVKKFETTANGVTVTGGIVTTANIDIDADSSLRVGDSQNLQIKYTGSEAQIVQMDNSNSLRIKVRDGAETAALFNPTGSVDLYYDDSKKFETTSTGINVTGTAVVDGVTIDGAYEQVSEAVSALDIDCSTGNYFTKTISGNSTFTFSNPASSGTVTAFTLELTHSSGTVTWPSSIKWSADTAPTLTTGKTHLFMFVTDDGGTRYRGSALVDYVN